VIDPIIDQINHGLYGVGAYRFANAHDGIDLAHQDANI
jgi:hypothetical protein